MPPAQAPMSGEQAEALLQQQILIPIFFQKLAQDYGWVPSSQDQAERVLRIGMKLLQAKQIDQAKSASAHGDFLGAAEEDLDRVLHQHGYAQQAAPQGPQSPSVKSAAAQLAADPTIRQAILVYHDAVQRQLEAQAQS